MFNFDFLRFRRQAPTNKPPSGYYDLRVSKTTGRFVLVDSDGTETEVGATLTSLTTTGAAEVGGALAVTGNTILGGTLGMGGNINMAANDIKFGTTGNSATVGAEAEQGGDLTYTLALGPGAANYIPTSDESGGGTGSAGAGNQYVALSIGENVYKVLHDGTV